MSYYADHMAWQQRVAQECKATSQYLSPNLFPLNMTITRFFEQ